MALLVAVCLLVGMLPALTLGPLVHVAAAAVLGADAAAVQAGAVARRQCAAGDERWWRCCAAWRCTSRCSAATSCICTTRAAGPAGWLFTRSDRRRCSALRQAPDRRLENGSLQRYAGLDAGHRVAAGCAALRARRRRAAAHRRRARCCRPRRWPSAVWALLLLHRRGAAAPAAPALRGRGPGRRGRAGGVAGLHRHVGARPGDDAAVGGRGLDRAAADGPGAAAADLAARIEPRCAAARDACIAAGRRRRHRRADLADADPRPRFDQLVLPGERAADGRRHQRRQRDPGRLPRLRHLRRDHRAGHRRASACWRCWTACARAGPALDPQGRAWSYAAEPLLLRRVARLVLPLALVVSVYIFWRGHNLPGGGFIAGLVTAAALVLQYMALGQVRAETLLQRRGRPPLRALDRHRPGHCMADRHRRLRLRPAVPDQRHGHPIVPVLGELPLATAACSTWACTSPWSARPC